MTIATFSEWLSNTAPSQFIQVTNWIIPAVQTVHILCIALLLSAAVVVDLRIFGAGLRSETLTQVADRFVPKIWACLPVLLVTGLILIIAEPGRTLGNPAFYLKMISLVVVIGVTQWLHNYARSARALSVVPALLAIVSVLLWATIIVSGRLIAYIESI
jgi:hypothetical protein